MRPKFTRDQESLCAKVRVIDDPDRLAERLGEIDPSIYHDLVISMGLPPSHIAGASDGEAAVHDLMLTMAFLTEGCIAGFCDGEAEVFILMFAGDDSILPGSFCARHVPTRTRLRKRGAFLAYTTGAAVPLLAVDRQVIPQGVGMSTGIGPTVLV